MIPPLITPRHSPSERKAMASGSMESANKREEREGTAWAWGKNYVAFAKVRK